MLEKREYQVRGVTKLLAALKKSRRVVAVSPTGSGKTVIAAQLIQKMKAKRVLWIAHRIELIRQAAREIAAAGVPQQDIGILSGVEQTNPEARIVVASVDMFRTRLVPKVDLIVVDEAHHIAATSYRNIVDVSKAPVLGLTATPWRLDGEPLGDVFKELVVIAYAINLIADKYLKSSVVYGIPQEKAHEIVRDLPKGSGDYSRRALEQAMQKRPLMGDVVREWERLANNERTIVYACTREHGRELQKRFQRAGISTEYLDWETPNVERAEIIGPKGRLDRGETLVVVNVGILTEGVDCPPVKCISIARPTRSLTLYLQMCGRASRPWKGKRPVVLDHAGNAWRFGLPETPREWSLDGRVKLNGDAPVKRCPSCEAMISTGFKECPECGAEQPLLEKELKERTAELERIRETEKEKAVMRTRLEEVARRKNAPRGWVEKMLQAVCT